MGDATDSGSRTDLSTDPLLERAPAHEGYKVLGGVVIYQKLGQGGMGAVYRGRHLRLNVDVAVKVMAPRLDLPPEQADAFVRRFFREAQTAAAVSHQNLVRVYDVNTEAGVHFIIMDYVDGESAGDRLKRRAALGESRLAEAEAVEICLAAAEGLAEAHRKGIVHRDVKPDNIMIDKQGRVRVTDLGLAKAFSSDETGELSAVTQTQAGMGTPFYMAPEQFVAARDVGPTADVWSLGVTLYQLVTGKLPWTDTSVFVLADKVRNEPLPDAKGVSADLSAGACEIIDGAVRKDPASRYADCGEMASALRGHLDSTRSPDGSTLADARAGSTKMSLVSVTPPPARTMSLIAEGFLAAPSVTGMRSAAVGAATPVTMPVRRGAPRRWTLPLALAGAAAVLVAALAAFLALRPDPLEVEAKTFYERQLAAKEAGRCEDVRRAIGNAAGKYDATGSGQSIRRLADEVDTLSKEKEIAEEAARKQAAFEKAVEAADEAEKRGDLAEAVRQLDAALGHRDDAAVRARLAGLGKLIAVRRLLDEAARQEEARDWKGARAVYEQALKDAGGEDRARALVGLARVRKRIEVEDAVAAVRRAANAKRWREAWTLIEEAKAAGISDPRLDNVSQRAVRELAPKKTLEGPLGVELVLVPGGSFRMGSDEGAEDERPAHEVSVSAFHIGRCEVTKAQFDAFRKGLSSEPKVSSDAAREPVVSVTWKEAMEFCRYLKELDSSGARYRLPTEAEWEFTARGTASMAYPWGDEVPDRKHANLAGDADGYEGLAPVGEFWTGASALGVLDLIGNAAEWCADWYGPYPAEPQVNPTGPAVGEKRVVKGSAFGYDAATWSRAAARAVSRPGERMDMIGFRVVRALTADEGKFLGLAEGGGE